MHHLSVSNREVIETLKGRYKSLRWYAKWFFPSKVRVALLSYQRDTESENIQALGLCKAFLNETWFIQRLFFYFFDSCLEEFSSSSLICTAEILNEAGLLTGDVAQANFNAVAGHQFAGAVSSALVRLQRENLLSGALAQASFDAVVGHQNPEAVSSALVGLQRANLLSGAVAQASIDAVVGHQNPEEVVSALRLLSRLGLLSGDAAQASFDAVVGHQAPYKVACALQQLDVAHLLTREDAQANCDTVAGQEYPNSAAAVLCMLGRLDLLRGHASQARRDAVARHQELPSVVQALRLLQRAGLLIGNVAQTNFDAVLRHQDPFLLACALELLKNMGLLTGSAAQGSFSALIGHSDILFFDGIVPWHSIPAHTFTPERFDTLINICHRHTDNLAAGRALVIAYINREILDMNEPAAGVPRLNAEQSTHTASVHQSVSESARRLMARYGAHISGRGLDETIQALSTWLNAQPDLPIQITTAKRCLERLIASDSFYTDPCSRVSMKRLLALFWIAIHDDACRMGTLEDAKLRLIEGLYEIQREYNLSATGEDNGVERDIPCCASGTFNKMIEKGQGVHPDMVIDFISMAGFSLKIPLVVNEVAMAYLKSLDILNLRPLIEAIKAAENANSVGPIWAEIRAVVAERMFNEFGSLFRNDGTTPEFLIAIAAGEFCPLNPNHLSELDKLIGQVSQDGGAAAASLRTAPDSFFAVAAATTCTNDNTTPGAAEAPYP